MKMPIYLALKFSTDTRLKELFDVFTDFWNEKRTREGVKNLTYSTTDNAGNPRSYDEKNHVLNTMFKEYVYSVAGVPANSELSMAQWATEPRVHHIAFAVINSIIDYVLPNTIIQSTGAYAEVRSGGFGDNFVFQIKPRDLFPVTKGNRNKRTSELQKQFNGTTTLQPEPRMITVSVSLPRVLSGLENLGDFVAKAVQSIETEMMYDVYTAFNTAVTSLPTTPTDGELKFVGYSQSNLVKLVQRVTAYNLGRSAVVLGTKLALQPILPQSANFRFDLESPYVRMGHLTEISGATILELAQVADWKNPFKLLLDDTRIYVVSPGSDKIVKLCIEGETVTNTTGPFQNADLTQSTTLTKNWVAGVVTNSVAGVITAS